MKAFSLQNPKSLEAAVELLGTSRDAKARDKVKLLAGGQDLLTEMKEHLVEPERLVNLKGIAGLDRIEIDPLGALSIGALVDDRGASEDAKRAATLWRCSAKPPPRSRARRSAASAPSAATCASARAAGTTATRTRAA